MLKKLSGVMAVGMLAPSAFAQTQGPKVGLVLRFDNKQVQEETKQNGSKKTTSDSKFVPVRARILITGDLTAQTSYSFTFSPKDRFNSGSEAYGVDGTPQSLILASIAHKFTDNIALTVGKLGINTLGIENNVLSGYDGFFYSHLGENFFDTYLYDGSEIGAQLDFNIAGEHNIAVQYLNGLKGDRKGVASDDANNSKGGTTATILYTGKLAGGLIEPLVSYSNFRHADRRLGNAKNGNGSWGKSDNINAYGVGVTVNVAGARIDIEQQGYSVAESKDNGVVVRGKEDASGQVIAANYKVNDMFTPWVRFTNDEIKWKGGDKHNSFNWGLGTYIFPEAGSTYRLHAAYYQEKVTIKGANPKEEKTKSTINLGVGLKV